MTYSLTFGPDQTAKGTPLHIAFGVDENYVPAMSVTMISIVTNNPEAHIIFYVIAASLPPGDLKILGRLAEQLKVTIKLHDPDKGEFCTLSDRKSLIHAAYNRLFLCEMLKDVATHVLYLDSDIVCLRPLPPLPELGDAIAAVVLDEDQDGKNAGIDPPCAMPYFNSGVMYIDVKRWNENDITNKVIESLLADKKRRFWDQDALNLALTGQVTWLGGKWNTFWKTSQSDRSAHSDAVFLHYAGHKPWQQWSPAFLDPPFAKYFSQSPWPARRLLNPVTRKHKGRYARYLFKSGNLPKALFWSIRSLCTRRNAAV
jgi:lipopolysaccharide biosynthesis glycosyltransferase